MKKKTTQRTRKPARDGSPYPAAIPYEPETWTPAQRLAHRAGTLETALAKATCLAGGWYARAVTIDYQVTTENDERYMLRPSEIPALADWTPCYEVKAVRP